MSDCTALNVALHAAALNEVVGESVIDREIQQDSSNEAHQPWCRYVLAGGVVLQVFLTSGLILGWGALMIILKREGTYSYLCDEGVEECGAMDAHLASIPSVGMAVVALMTLVTGPVTALLGLNEIVVPHALICLKSP
eukprot:GHVN01051907.1.p1 GENE.GHVN01051907.1~~GHVN01051907.1.p1  ORF type:complete len:138 (-),score=17.10 GHVN01051907.1:658-1071(-)